MIKQYAMPLSFSKTTDGKQHFKVQTTCVCKLCHLVVADYCEGVYTIEKVQADGVNLIPFPQPAQFYVVKKAVELFGRLLHFNHYLKVCSTIEVIVSHEGKPEPPFKAGLIVEAPESPPFQLRRKK